ncbi:glycosyltransferase family 4 protein, partial [Escherichia coli]|nr:glycosyltransferase family 4 protein [Escherichia coli]
YDLIYFTPAESKMGSYKDQLIYLFMFAKLKKMYIHLHGGAGMKKLLEKDKSLIFKLNKYFISRLAGVIVLGERLKSIYNGIIESDKIYAVENFSQDYLFIRQSELKLKFNNRNKIKILFLSNLLPGKGYIELLKSADFLDDSCVEFHFAGGFEDEQAKKIFLEAINLKNNIFYHGIVSGDEKRNLLIKSDIFCLPTYYPYEGQPISILEAYAAGCVVLTTNHSGIFDVFEPWRNGIEVDKKSTSDLVNAINYFNSNREEIRKIAINNIVDARKKYRLKHHLEKMMTVLMNHEVIQQ